MQDQGSWEDCPSGVMTGMADQLRRRQRQKQMRPFLFLGVTALLLCVISYGWATRGESGGLTCHATATLIARHQTQPLDAAEAKCVREHLSRCPKCREHFEGRYPSEVRNRSSVEPGLFAIAARFHPSSAIR